MKNFINIISVNRLITNRMGNFKPIGGKNPIYMADGDVMVLTRIYDLSINTSYIISLKNL